MVNSEAFLIGVLIFGIKKLEKKSK